jgi:hypothetical protein
MRHVLIATVLIAFVVIIILCSGRPCVTATPMNMRVSRSQGNQTPTPTPDPALVALQAQQAIMDAKLKIQQDQMALTTGALPTSATTPNSGAFTVSGSNPFPSQKLAYGELVNIAAQIAYKVPGSGPVAVYDSAEINSLVNFKAISKQLNFFKAQVVRLEDGSLDLDKKALALQKLAPATVAERDFAPALVPGLAEGSLKTMIDIIGLFRTNTNIAYSNFTPDDVALTAAVVQTLVAKRTVYQPSVVSISALDDSSSFMENLSGVQTLLASIQDRSAADQSTIQQISDALGAFIQASQSSQTNLALTAAQTDPAKKADQASKQPALDLARNGAQQYADDLLRGTNPAELDVSKATQKKADCDQFLRVMGSFVASTSTISTAFGTLQTALMKVTDSGAAALTGILRAEKLRGVFDKDKSSLILVVKTSVLGGSVVTRTNWWTGGHLLFTGGAIANFTVFNVDGSVAASGLVIGESGKVKDKF